MSEDRPARWKGAVTFILKMKISLHLGMKNTPKFVIKLVGLDLVPKIDLQTA